MKGGTLILQWLRDWLEMYTWWEIWLVASIPTVIAAFWFLLGYFISIKNDVIRTVAIWSMLFLLTLAGATVDALRRQKSK